MMNDSWNPSGMSDALPNVTDTNAGSTAAANSNAPVINPQDCGWADKTAYDYDKYTKSAKELSEMKDAKAAADNVESHYPDAVGGITVGDWHNNAAVYIWDDEYGDVGPEFPELERQLFGSEYHMKTGIEFKRLSSIKVVQEGEVRIKPISSFQGAGLHPVMLRNVELAGYDTPTPIQQYCLPAVFMGYDIVACAQTGSGKTAAFLVPILSKLMGKAKKLCAPRPNPAKYQPGITKPVRAEPLVCIVVPSRELATQIFDEARRFCYRSMLRPCVIYGGGPIRDQIMQLKKGCDVLIGTPGRLVDFINRPNILTLKRLKYMVIDEADEMVSNDWGQEMSTIMSGGDQEEGNINYLMFSATFPKLARQLAKEHLAMNHLRIRVGRAGSTHGNITQEIINVDPSLKREALQQYLLSMPPARTIIFVNSKRSADELDDFLFNSSFPCTSIHSGRTQREREDSIRAFRTGKTPILIATGVSARGLDIFNVMAVINFDLPSHMYGGIDEYCHRIGRTGRIGNMGVAMSFFSPNDEDLAPDLVKFLLETHQKIPEFLAGHIPEGFDANGQGNEKKLNFGDDSDISDNEDADRLIDGQASTTAATQLSPGQAADGWGFDSATQKQQPAAKTPNSMQDYLTSGWDVQTDSQLTPTQQSVGNKCESISLQSIKQPKNNHASQTVTQQCKSRPAQQFSSAISQNSLVVPKITTAPHKNTSTTPGWDISADYSVSGTNEWVASTNDAIAW